MHKSSADNGTFPTTDQHPLPAIEQICIVGRNVFQNHLLKQFLEDQLAAAACQVTLHNEWELNHSNHGDAVNDLYPLTLWDCFGVSPVDMWIKLGLGGGPDPRRQAIVLFNVEPDPGRDFEFQAIERSVRGVFYLNEPPQRLAKGIESILDGELWYSRKTFSRLLMDPQRFRPRDEASEAMLTAREREILVAIAAGATNSEIAAKFHISLHTVKTHIYNLYKKIDVHNRLEATLWVARYL